MRKRTSITKFRIVITWSGMMEVCLGKGMLGVCSVMSDPGIGPASSVVPALADGFFIAEPLRKPSFQWIIMPF